MKDCTVLYLFWLTDGLCSHSASEKKGRDALERVSAASGGAGEKPSRAGLRGIVRRGRLISGVGTGPGGPLERGFRGEKREHEEKEKRTLISPGEEGYSGPFNPAGLTVNPGWARWGCGGASRLRLKVCSVKGSGRGG